MSMIVTKACQAAVGVASMLREKGIPKRCTSKTHFHTMILVTFALLCVTVELDLSQLCFVCIGALVYGGLESTRKAAHSKLKKHTEKGMKGKTIQPDEDIRTNNSALQRKMCVARTVPKTRQDTNMTGKQEVWKQSVQPVAAPTFSVDSFEAQVQELVSQIAPTAAGEKVVQQLSGAVKKLLSHSIPQADVSGYASADVMIGSAFAVAIPEIDIVLSASPGILAESLQNHRRRPVPHASKLDARRLQKAALRICTDDLVAGGGFKFRRSAFKGDEPKVTLIAPPSMGIHTASVPISFSVNTVTPFYSAAFLTECGQMDSRAMELILLVRRWAKDRGISHASKGHLSPYVWTLFVIYFLQVRTSDRGPLLPALGGFKLSSGLRRRQQMQHECLPDEKCDVPNKSVAMLFVEFISFYVREFSWHNEAVSVRAGKRAPPGVALRYHIVVNERGSTEAAPCIEDPFEPKCNLSTHMTAVSIDRLRDELSRADELCSQQSPLSKLLELWTPGEPSSVPADCDDDE